MLSMLCAAVFVQVDTFKVISDKNLSPATRPYIELAEFKRLPCVSVSEVRSSNGKESAVTRVYRFTYEGDYWDEVDRWKAAFRKKDGWKVEVQATSKDELIMSRNVNDPHVKEQALILHTGRITFDAKVKAQAKAERVKGWVWVSMNEILKK